MLCGNKPAGRAPTSEAVETAHRQRRVIFIAAVFVVLVLLIVGISYYMVYIAPFRRTVIEVDDTSISMGYFLKRIQLADSNAMEMLEVLTKEQIIEIEAPRYVGEVTPEDIDQELRKMARGKGGTISEAKFKEWYRQILNETGFSNSEYRKIISTRLLTNRLKEYLGKKIPTKAEQVYLYKAELSTKEVAEIRKKKNGGENLDRFINEIWQNKRSEGEVEDIGWTPRGVLPPPVGKVVFNLPVGEISEPVGYMGEDHTLLYYLMMVSKKADARHIDKNSLKTLKAKALDDWVAKEMKSHKVEWHGIKNGFDSETLAWINSQLAKAQGD